MLPQRVLTGGTSSYPRCRAEASRLRRHGATALVAPSAALLPGQAHGWTVSRRKVRPGRPRDGKVWVYFGPRPGFVGWCAAVAGPPVDLAGRVRFR
jgi:hypothetical protein